MPKQSKERRSEKEHKSKEPESEDEDVIDLCEDHDYQVLSAIFETEKGKNVAEILSKIQKDLHLLATSVYQLVQLGITAQQVGRSDDEKSENGSDMD